MSVTKIRSAQDGDFENIVDCLAEVRGDTYYEPRVYDPAFLRNGNFAFFIAETGTGEMAGVIALSNGWFDDTLCVLSHLAVKKRFGGLGIGTSLYFHAAEQASKRGYPSVKTHIVTDHTTIQKAAEKSGFVPTGILHGIRDCAKGFRREGLRSDKRSLSLYVKPGTKRDAGCLYIPEALIPSARRVYHNLEISCCLSADGGVSEKSVINHLADTHHCVIIAQVLACGVDLRERIVDMLHALDTPPYTMTVLLNINHSSAIYGYGLLCDLGFLYSGFDPAGRENENIIMFHTGSVCLCHDEIHMTETLRKEVADHV